MSAAASGPRYWHFDRSTRHASAEVNTGFICSIRAPTELGLSLMLKPIAHSRIRAILPSLPQHPLSRPKHDQHHQLLHHLDKPMLHPPLHIQHRPRGHIVHPRSSVSIRGSNSSHTPDTSPYSPSGHTHTPHTCPPQTAAFAPER